MTWDVVPFTEPMVAILWMVFRSCRVIETQILRAHGVSVEIFHFISARLTLSDPSNEAVGNVADCGPSPAKTTAAMEGTGAALRCFAVSSQITREESYHIKRYTVNNGTTDPPMRDDARS